MDKDSRYVWREGRKPPDIDPEVAARELERIYKKHGNELLPTDVVEESRPEGAPLHPAFDWNNKEAAEKWRRHQARLIIRGVQIEFPNRDREPQWVHAVVHPVGTRGVRRFYQDASIIVERPDEYASAITEAQRYLQQALERVNVLQAMARARHKKKDQQRVLTLLAESLATAKVMATRLM